MPGEIAGKGGDGRSGNAGAAAFDVTDPAAWQSGGTGSGGEWQGGGHGSRISIIINEIAEIGQGARLHRHPYAEVFLVRRGTVDFTIGDETLTCHAGQIVVAPANIPHSFVNAGPGPLEMVDIHESPAFDTIWIDRTAAPAGE